jgi:TonB family protein
LSLIISLVIPFLPTPKPVQKRLDQVSPRLAKLIIEKKKQKAPIPKVKPRVIKKETKRKASKKTRAAKKKAQQSGLLAMKSELAALQNAFDMSSLNDSTPLSRADTSRTKASTTSIDKTARKGSGGINTRSLSTRTGGTGLTGRTSSSVKSNIASTGSGGQSRINSQTKRSEEEIALIFEKNKGAIFSLYNRALRKDPTLQGKVVLELTINSKGKVTKCRVISSELKNKSLERKLVARIMLFRFPAKQVKSTTVTYPIDFLPS